MSKAGKVLRGLSH